MRYLLALLLPPLAVLLCGKPMQFLLNCGLCLCLWVPGIVHAVLVVAQTQADERTSRLASAIRDSARPKADDEGDEEDDERACIECGRKLPETFFRCRACRDYLCCKRCLKAHVAECQPGLTA